MISYKSQATLKTIKHQKSSSTFLPNGSLTKLELPTKSISPPKVSSPRKTLNNFKTISPKNSLSPSSLSARKRSPVMSKITKQQLYPIDKPIGSGAFGTVYRSTHLRYGYKVAVKKVLQDVRYKNRELGIMKQLRHSNVVGLIDTFIVPSGRECENHLYLVMDYYPLNLLDIIQNYYNYKKKMPISLVKVYAYQILRGLMYCELLKICHRDIKPQNILVDPITHKLVICDFGCAKKLSPGESNVSYICSRYYRSPEMIMGSQNYDCISDVWSAGCVIAEMALGLPIFYGKTPTDQLLEIIKVLGTPTKDEIFEINPKFQNVKLPDLRRSPWSRVFSGEYEELYDLLDKILVLLPSKRYTALQALQHPFFDELKNDHCRLPNGRAMPPFFDWNDQEIQAGVDLLLDPHNRKTQ